MLKVMITGAVISRGYEGEPALKITQNEGGVFISFRIGMRLYDPKADNNTKWLNLTVKASRWMAERVQKMQLDAGQRVNLCGTLEEEVWIDREQKKQSMLSISLIDIEKSERGQMLLVFGTTGYISKGFNDKPAIKYSENAASFRLSFSVYDKNAENNRRWMNLSARAFDPVIESMQKLGFDGGSCVNFWGRLDVSTWNDEQGATQTTYQIIVDKIEPAKKKEQEENDEGVNGVQNGFQSGYSMNNGANPYGANQSPQYQRPQYQQPQYQQQYAHQYQPGNGQGQGSPYGYYQPAAPSTGGGNGRNGDSSAGRPAYNQNGAAPAARGQNNRKASRNDSYVNQENPFSNSPGQAQNQGSHFQGYQMYDQKRPY